MKTKKSTKLVLGLAVAAFAFNGVHAQSTSTPTTGGKLWGYVMADYAYAAKGDSAGRGNGILYKGVANQLPGSGGQSSSFKGQTNAYSGQNAFDIRRAYLGYDYVINEKFSATTLLAYEGDQDVNGNKTVFLKNAYFTWKNIFPGSNLTVGQQPTCSFATPYQTEPLYGYRSMDKTIMDMRKVDGSTDMAIGLAGKIWQAKADSGKMGTLIGYAIQVGNNSGNSPIPGFDPATTSLSGATITSTSTSTTTPISIPTISQKTGNDTTITVTPTTTTKTTTTTSYNGLNTTTDKAKKFRFNLYVNALNGALTVGAYADYINYGQVYYGTATGYASNIMTVKGYANYSSKWFGVGAEYFMQSKANGEVTWDPNAPLVNNKVVMDTASATQSGWSVWARGTVMPDMLNIFARVDMYNPDTKYSSSKFTSSSLVSANNYTEMFLSAGLDWTPTKDKKVHIEPNIWYDAISYQGVPVLPSGSKTWASDAGSGQLKAANYMIARLTFYYIFK